MILNIYIYTYIYIYIYIYTYIYIYVYDIKSYQIHYILDIRMLVINY